jgi:bifunctional N-acetylglucosamine-1-phosphate-uridyltransferase/glucosamine-1-phosphate-acetyltransferase GlmU-like protein
MINNNIQLIIPMSGIGKRFVDAGYEETKSLIDVDGYPIIKHVVDLFPGVKDVIFICNDIHLKQTNMRKILNDISPNCRIFEVVNNTKGPINAIHQIFDFIDDNKQTIVSYCDYGTYWDFENFINYVNDKNLDGAIPCYTGFHPHMLGSDNYAFCKENNMELIQIKEKEPFTDNKMNEYASNGTYYFKSGLLLKEYSQKLIDLDININGEYYVSLLYNLLVNDGLKVGIFEIENMLQWGTPYDLENYKSWSKYFSNINLPQIKIKNPPNTTLILPMAGKGSRFAEEGYDLPKPLLDVDGLPMILQAVDCLPESDNNVFICLQDHVDNFDIDKTLKNYFLNTEIISINETTEGQACTCEIGIKETNVNLENPILISACDNGVFYDRKKYLELLNDESIDVIVWTFRNNQASKTNPNAYAWLDVDENNNIKHVSCKKFIYENPLTTHAIIGTMFFRKGRYFMEGLQKNYNENIRTNGEFYVDDVLNQNIKDGLKVKVFEVENYICWGTPNDYKTYNYWNKYFNKINIHKKNDYF